MRSCAEEHPATFVRYFRGLREYRDLLKPITPRDPSTNRTNTYIVWGPTRTNKSKKCFEAALKINPDSIYYKNRSNWWHGYHQEETVIIDDFYGWLKWDELLKICDRYPYKVETKGSFEEFTSKHIFITSNKAPEEWYKFDGFDPAPLLSDRINFVYNTTNNTITHYHASLPDILTIFDL